MAVCRTFLSNYLSNLRTLLLDTPVWSHCSVTLRYYNSVLWLTPELSSVLKQSLLSISANALRSCMLSNCNEISFENIHKLCKKCTPSQIMYYQTSLQLHKSINEIYECCTSQHAALLNNIVCTGRQLKFEILRNNRSKIGMNSFSNKFYHVSKLIGLDNLNLTFVHFKKIMKIQFLKNGKTWLKVIVISWWGSESWVLVNWSYNHWWWADVMYQETLKLSACINHFLCYKLTWNCVNAI